MTTIEYNRVLYCRHQLLCRYIWLGCTVDTIVQYSSVLGVFHSIVYSTPRAAVFVITQHGYQSLLKMYIAGLEKNDLRLLRVAILRLAVCISCPPFKFFLCPQSCFIANPTGWFKSSSTSAAAGSYNMLIRYKTEWIENLQCSVCDFFAYFVNNHVAATAPLGHVRKMRLVPIAIALLIKWRLHEHTSGPFLYKKFNLNILSLLAQTLH